ASHIFSLTHAASSQIYPLSLHDALPISLLTVSSLPFQPRSAAVSAKLAFLSLYTWIRPSLFLSSNFTRPVSSQVLIHSGRSAYRSEEHTSELQSRENLVCRLLLEKKKEK